MIDQVFLRTAEAAERLLRHPTVASRWNAPSSLDGYTVGALSGHLARAVQTVLTCLDAPESSSGRAPSEAADYFLTVLATHDPVDSDFHRAVRQRGAEASGQGARALADQFSSARRILEQRLDEEQLDRRVEVLGGLVLTMGEYLRTRLLELVVHLDDLAVGVGLDASAEISDEAYRITAGLLGEIAAAREGGPATVRSLSRRERHPGAVRAF
ncbi:maleylpyruvate isomerase N-terminal domain-containing protein [Nocardiopsis salina]|uniref:maleylpyruvate isomerase N-terminal domain-containing protein n=1 Tax=Nocardiopsis salina TaxID=245836 RepID=UPI0003451989|nr:maleylpyruvate isomerase N-terminal domain-containing protein [Nocardiopsis salina]